MAVQAATAKLSIHEKVDRLKAVRDQKKVLESEEKSLVFDLTAHLQKHNILSVKGIEHVLVKTEQKRRVVDPGGFVKAVGLDDALPALTVRVEVADRMLSPSELEKLTTIKAVSVLLVS